MPKNLPPVTAVISSRKVPMVSIEVVTQCDDVNRDGFSVQSDQAQDLLGCLSVKSNAA